MAETVMIGHVARIGEYMETGKQNWRKETNSKI
jgi:hypothetical protein